ncbi:MAG: hypothetical protein AYK22_01440 [Thermoplasmatales archaeon SG8-52-3]|nr:MAG: hypothetical protein AYK22_01440 [Thermoplasmatales archaeon SG8-52-3]
MKNKKEKIRKYLILFFANYVIRYYQYIHHLVIPYFKKENNPKIFCIGYVKTGTTSLYKALSILGYRSVKMLRGCVKPKEGWIKYIKSCKYDAYTDYPMFVDNFFKEIDKAYPNSKFILTIRDINSWLKSYTNYYFVSSDLSKNEGKQKLNEHNKKVIAYFKDKPSKLLVMNIIDGDGWEKLCKFLNKPVPNKPFPHKNIGKYKKF